jgi:hypothetical protein
MLRIVIEDEGFDNDTQTFETITKVIVDLEHSLASLSKWESKYQKPFLSGEDKTGEEIFDYIKAMVVNPGVDPNVLVGCDTEQLKVIQKYIDSPESATTFGEMSERRGRGEIITAELIYYWMVAFTIPFECEHWHLNRLFALIRICNIKNSKPQPMPRHEAAAHRHRLNQQRREQLGTRG